MPRDKKPNVRPRFLAKRPLTPKQLAFLRYYTEPGGPACGNGVRAAELAGYAGKAGSTQLRVQAHRTLHRRDIKQILQEHTMAEMVKLGYGAEFRAQLLMRGMTATEVRLVPNSNGERVPRTVQKYETQLHAFDRAQRLFESKNNDIEGYESSAEESTQLHITAENPYTKLSPEDRMVARSVLEKMITLIQLKRALEEQEAKKEQNVSPPTND